MRATPSVSLTLTAGSIGSSTRYSAERTYLVINLGNTTGSSAVDSYTADAEL